MLENDTLNLTGVLSKKDRFILEAGLDVKKDGGVNEIGFEYNGKIVLCTSAVSHKVLDMVEHVVVNESDIIPDDKGHSFTHEGNKYEWITTPNNKEVFELLGLE